MVIKRTQFRHYIDQLQIRVSEAILKSVTRPKHTGLGQISFPYSSCPSMHHLSLKNSIKIWYLCCSRYKDITKEKMVYFNGFEVWAPLFICAAFLSNIGESLTITSLKVNSVCIWLVATLNFYSTCDLGMPKTPEINALHPSPFKYIKLTCIKIFVLTFKSSHLSTIPAHIQWCVCSETIINKTIFLCQNVFWLSFIHMHDNGNEETSAVCNVLRDGILTRCHR